MGINIKNDLSLTNGPIVSAAMDRVTESLLAIELAKQGGSLCHYLCFLLIATLCKKTCTQALKLQNAIIFMIWQVLLLSLASSKFYFPFALTSAPPFSIRYSTSLYVGILNSVIYEEIKNSVNKAVPANDKIYLIYICQFICANVYFTQRRIHRSFISDDCKD